jgi:hypothetical protein
VKRAVVGYGRADKRQVQQMIKLLLGLDKAPSPYDASDALAVAICHLHSARMAGIRDQGSGIKSTSRLIPDPGSLVPEKRQLKSWRQYRPPAHG